ncbi:ureidoglycolate hydrolase [Diplogelasinospora grovesii]|uniref:Ureidoglycolate hydrolase n=1 Tax=Diplogelasinospora grovesii TaxID=303347 RepID=A0AAN6N2I2_9PEZI|nr:ureidoglycolate hydrolase [Diplogelasinospora grovesii]
MASPLTIKLDGQAITVNAVPLNQAAFAPFGDVIENPRPDLHPSTAGASSALPSNAVVANQGSAIKYQHVSRMRNLYEQAPSGQPGAAIMSMFVCAARQLRGSEPERAETFSVEVLERHPYTTQTFIPLTGDASKRYLVIVAPSLPPSMADQDLPTPDATGLPGRGLPDLRGLRAFVATAQQAVTYGAGTWHAPMVALGPRGTAIDFVVVQFANGVGVEDCQEVYFTPSSSSPSEKRTAGGGVVVNVPAQEPVPRVIKL